MTLPGQHRVGGKLGLQFLFVILWGMVNGE